MKDKNEFPTTLLEAIKYFADDQRAFDYMKAVRWPTGKVSCPRCSSEKNSFVSTRKIWHCSDCKRQFSIKVGTIFEDSAIKYDKWICATWLIANAKNGISSYELGRSIGVCQKTAWFMLQRIRLAMQNGTVVKMGGTVEVDETFIGGAARFMHKVRRKALKIKTGPCNMTPVQGLLERNTASRKSRIVLKVMKNRRMNEATKHVKEYVLKESHVYTDKLASYQYLGDDFTHKIIDHAERYVDGVVHTNGLENFWCLLKRTLKGTYVNVEPFHLFRYLDEQSFRFNEREDTDSGRFQKAIKGIIGKSLTFAKLTGKNEGDGRLELVPA
jgi:transposase-like protein